MPLTLSVPGGIVVPPLEVVEGAGGEDLHLVPLGQALGQPAAVQLRPAVDLEAVALDDEGELHGRPRAPAGGLDLARRASYLPRTTSQE